MSQTTNSRDPEPDPDADPENLNPRDTRAQAPYDGDSGNFSPRSSRQAGH